MNFVRVRRLKSDCCGMKVGQIYNADLLHGGSYVIVYLEDGSATSFHFVDTWFEILND